jgi:hypothetical protein
LVKKLKKITRKKERRRKKKLALFMSKRENYNIRK